MVRLPHPLLAFIAATLLVLLAGAPALAHAQLLASDPAHNAVLAEAPARLELVYNEPVSPLALVLVGPDGATAELAAEANGAVLTIEFPETLAGGTHVLSWRVVSIDAHPVAGSVIFSIGAPTGAVDVAPASPATSLLLWLGKALLFSALFIGIGGAVFALAAPLPPPARKLAGIVSAAGLVLAPLSLGLHGADALGRDPIAMLSPAVWSTGFATSYGMTVLMLAAALALALVALTRPRWIALAWPAWLLAALSLAVSGHAGAAEPQWLTRAAVGLHIGGILFWVGALLPLWHWLHDRSGPADHALSRFSRVIPLAVAALLLSGVTLAVVQLGLPGPAWLSPYGFILLAKLGLLALLFALALWNRFRLTRPTLAGEPAPRRQLRRIILLEVLLVLAVFGLAAGWRFTPPPRVLAAVEAAQAALNEPAYAHAMDDSLMVDIAFAPGRVGPVTFQFWLTDLEGDPVSPESVAVTFAAPDLGIAPFTATATEADGLWRLDNQIMPLPGPWDVMIDIRISRFSLVTLATQIDIQP